MHNFVEIFLEYWSNEEVFDAKRISYSELHVHVGFASRILHHKFMLHGLMLMSLQVMSLQVMSHSP